MTDDGKLGHGSLECGLHLGLLADEALPGAGSAGVASEVGVGKETHLTDVFVVGQRKGRLGFSDVACASWETNTSEEDLREDLGVKLEGE